MNQEVCERLDWDSDFFGVNIARANTSQLDPDTIEAINAWCKGNSIDCLYFLAGGDDTKTIRIAEDQRFRLVEVRITMELKLAGWEPKNYPKENPDILIRAVRAEDLPILQSIAEGLYVNTRFYVDERFPNDKSQQFYQTWIKNICEGRTEMGLVAELDGQIQGFISGRKSGAIGQLDLVGVRANTQGTGIGYELIRSGTVWYPDHGAEYIYLYTQGRNIVTQRLLQRLGFLTKNCQLYYHKWYSD